MTRDYTDMYGKEVLPGIMMVRGGIFLFNPGEYSPSHAIITRDAVRELAGQLDPPNDCPYRRGGDAQHNAELLDEEGTLAYIDGYWLRIETFAWSGDATDVSFEVTYCPKCGRKLEAKP